eukprot:TRINITY_DN986_c4_g1_i1.p1 TRINITY_DN986_c4_g1~~TRINITY_DN986_c4_g1_i1.p1  ORF type:complete len:117 (-),score=28.55 TRINITY_DN986_c4_g1_i1:127-477(-)
MIDYKCLIEHNGDEKYILVRANLSQFNKIELMIVSFPLLYHYHILNKLSTIEPYNNADLEVLGGGILTINREKKEIKTYGQSGGFGPPCVDQVREVLTNCFPDWKLDITVTSYIRG